MAFRRSHKKSRAGCLECKRRHIKCDEARPVCRLCTMAERERYCSYGPQVSATKPPPSVQSNSSTGSMRVLMPSSSHESTPSSAHSDVNMDGLELPNHSSVSLSSATTNLPTTPDPHQSAFPAPGPSSLPGEVLNMEHMELLVHVLRTKGFFNLGVNIGNYYKQIAIGMEYGFKDPYLIHQFFAYSARHLAHLHPGRYLYFAHQADAHQARAIQLFNLAVSPSSSSSLSVSADTQSETHNPINQSNCVALVLFSSALGQTLIAETFDARLHPTFVHPKGDLDAFLTAYTTCLRTFHGVFQIAREAWPLLLNTPLAGYMIYSREFNQQIPRGHHCDLLVNLLDTTHKLGKISVVEHQVCLQMARFLQVGFDAILLSSESTTTITDSNPESASSSLNHANLNPGSGPTENNSPGNASTIPIDPRLDHPDFYVPSDLNNEHVATSPNSSPQSGITSKTTPGSGSESKIDIHTLEVDHTDPEMTALNKTLNKYQMLSAFTMLAPQEYSSMLERKRPEALVVLAYYALLLHYGRHMWQVGDSGQVILGMVADYLGLLGQTSPSQEWGVWIRGPLDVVFGLDQGAGAGSA